MSDFEIKIFVPLYNRILKSMQGDSNPMFQDSVAIHQSIVDQTPITEAQMIDILKKMCEYGHAESYKYNTQFRLTAAGRVFEGIPMPEPSKADQATETNPLLDHPPHPDTKQPHQASNNAIMHQGSLILVLVVIDIILHVIDLCHVR